MQKLKDMKVKKSLLLGYGVSIGLGMIFVFVCIALMAKLSVGYRDVIDTTIKSNQVIAKVRLDANRAARDLRDVALIPDDPNNPKLIANINKSLENMNAGLDELIRIYPLDKDKLNEYIDICKDWQKKVPEILDAIEKDKIDEAIHMIQFDCTPSLNKMVESAGEIAKELSDLQTHDIAGQKQTVILFVVVISVIMLISLILVVRLVHNIVINITEPTAEVHKALVGFSKGEFNIDVNFESENELGEMCEAMRTSQRILNNVIVDIGQVLGKMGDGDFNVRSNDRSMYVGGLQPVLVGMRDIKSKLTDVLTKISLTADQVSSGADQVSSGAQGLSQGATEQASSVEELAATITDISQQINRNAENAQHATVLAQNVGEEVVRSNEQMEKMTVAMTEINNKSTEIGKIIKTIEDIAFQTNILALNAAVEAARAGVAGKGFAVVADEVRNLASKSAEASKNTSALIESTVKAVENGTQIASDTAQSLLAVVGGAKEVVSTISEISEASQQQALAVEQVTIGVDQISSVVQTNTATAEESAASSQELSAQANLLNDLVGQFVLSDEDTDAAHSAVSSAEDEPFDYNYGNDKY